LRNCVFFPLPCHQLCQRRGSTLGSVPMSSFGPIVMVSGRSVLSHSVRQSKVFDGRPPPMPVLPPAPPPHE
jgi:hypothetical protein